MMMPRMRRLLGVSSLTALTLAGVSVPAMGGPIATATSAVAGSGVSITRTIARTHLVGGGDQVAETRTVTMTVDQTKNLRSRQPVSVTWKGAHPTGDPQADINSPLGVNDEFPFVLLECRGVDSTTVPVSQQLTPDTCWTQTGPQERFTQTPSTAFPAWRVDRYAPAQERTFHVDDPSPLPTGCDSYPTYATRRVPFVSVTGTTYYPDGSSCTPQPPEALVVDNADSPGNTTYGVTRPDGTGDTKFTVWSSQDNASLGCGQTVACALVAVPVLGVSCDIAAASLPASDRPPASDAAAITKDCSSTGNYTPGQQFNGTAPALSVSGRLWFTASNWRNRITVPLSFAPADNVCDVVGGKQGVDLYGSELMTQAMIQWRPAFCLDPKRTPFQHVQVGEPQAASLLVQSSIEAGLLSHPPDRGYGHPVVNAPVALTGFTVSYVIDDAQGSPYTTLRLTPRLLAKLLTMSYPGQNFVQQEYAALKANPLDISRDPEFQALNPGIAKGVTNSVSAATILSLSSDSDVVRALTTYITSDKEARAWLDGAADPWGMKVNPSYLKIALPVQTWPLLDTFEPRAYYASGSNPCLQNSPVPYLPLIASPTIRMANITFALQFADATSQVDCVVATPGSTVGLKLAAGGRETPGNRFVLGITSLGDAARYRLDAAALQTSVASGSPVKFTNGGGRTFVSPADAGLGAAARLLTPNAATGVWDLPVTSIVNSVAARAAYPGSMVVYAAVPTTGLTAKDATAYATLLDWMVSTGQSPGTTNGTLPPGYLPLTAANGLGALQSYTLRAAAAVAAQKGAVPSLVATSVGAGSNTAGTGSGTTSGALGSAGSGASGGFGASGAPGGSGGSAGSSAKPGGVGGALSGPAQKGAKKVAGAGALAGKAPIRIATVAQDVGLTGAMALILSVLALILAGAVPLTQIVRRLRAQRG
jgi:hypothetical protein